MSVIHEKVHAIGMKFLRKLPERIEGIRTRLSSEGAVPRRQTLLDLEETFHTLAATAATLRLPVPASIAAAAEALCHRTASDPGPGVRESLETLLQNLCASAADRDEDWKPAA